MTTEQCFGDEIPAGSGVIEVHLAELSQLFNSIDPSPFHERDLDRDAGEFIVGWAKELPADKPLALLIHLDQPALTPEIADTLRNAIHTFFRDRSKRTRRRLAQLFRIGRTSLAIGLLFLTACLIASEQAGRLLTQTPLVRVLRESLLIGGWVAMWRPLEIFLYDWWPIRYETRLYDRLGAMPVRIACSGRQRPARASQPF